MKGFDFFVIGAARSGTTWLSRLLNSHPAIHCSGEDNFVRLGTLLATAATDYHTYVHALNDHGMPSTGPALFSQEALGRLVIEAVHILGDQTREHTGAPVVGSKCNEFANSQTDFFARNLDRARFIHIVRDGRDVICSAWARNMAAAQAETLERWGSFSQAVGPMTETWVHDVTQARGIGQAFPDRYHEIAYEDLLSAPHAVLKGLFEFLGASQDDATVAACLSDNAFETLTAGRTQGQEAETAFVRKGIAGDWQNKMTDADLAAFDAAGGTALLNAAR